jgi:predicted negative regulator of RcsB-dependent stress response
MSNQKGFSPVIALAIIAVVAVVGFAGWRVYDAKNSNDQASTSSVQTTQEPSIDSTQDVAQAEQDLNNLNIDDELDPSVLDEDIANLQ